jgi:hypothetical protein
MKYCRDTYDNSRTTTTKLDEMQNHFPYFIIGDTETTL